MATPRHGQTFTNEDNLTTDVPLEELNTPETSYDSRNHQITAGGNLPEYDESPATYQSTRSLPLETTAGVRMLHSPQEIAASFCKDPLDFIRANARLGKLVLDPTTLEEARSSYGQGILPKASSRTQRLQFHVDHHDGTEERTRLVLDISPVKDTQLDSAVADPESSLLDGKRHTRRIRAVMIAFWLCLLYQALWIILTPILDIKVTATPPDDPTQAEDFKWGLAYFRGLGWYNSALISAQASYAILAIIIYGLLRLMKFQLPSLRDSRFFSYYIVCSALFLFASMKMAVMIPFINSHATLHGTCSRS